MLPTPPLAPLTRILAPGFQAVILEGHHAKHRCEARRADHHGLPGGHRTGEFHEPLRLYAARSANPPDQLSPTPPPGQHDPVSDLECIAGRVPDRAGKVDARNDREAAQDSALALQREPVLVVEGRSIRRRRVTSPGGRSASCKILDINLPGRRRPAWQPAHETCQPS